MVLVVGQSVPMFANGLYGMCRMPLEASSGTLPKGRPSHGKDAEDLKAPTEVVQRRRPGMRNTHWRSEHWIPHCPDDLAMLIANPTRALSGPVYSIACWLCRSSPHGSMVHRRFEPRSRES
jgi:hypothetical protein